MKYVEGGHSFKVGQDRSQIHHIMLVQMILVNY